MFDPQRRSLSRSMRGTAARLTCTGFLAAATLSGCFLWTSRGEGDELKTAQDRDRTRVANLEESIRGERDKLQTDSARMQEKMAELEGVLERATQVVTRNSADLSVEVTQLRTQIGALQGEIAELRNQNEQLTKTAAAQRTEIEERIDRVARRAGVDVALSASDIPADKAQHFAAAERAFQSADHSKARALFREFVVRYGQDDQADNAAYMVGKCYLAEGRPATALTEFRKVITEYASGDAVDDALMDMAEAFYRLRACTDARGSLDALIRSQTNSPLRDQARQKLREWQRPPRGYCTS